jgi:hypothetical protein
MQKLFGAANARIVGAGVADYEFLRGISELVGDHDVISRDVPAAATHDQPRPGSGANGFSRSPTCPGCHPAAQFYSPRGSRRASWNSSTGPSDPTLADVRDSESVYSAPANHRRALS